MRQIRKKTMTETKVADGELTDTQKRHQDKAKKIYEILNEKPKDGLMPFLRFTERGVYPDVKIVEVDERPNKETKGESEGESTVSESVEAPDAE